MWGQRGLYHPSLYRAVPFASVLEGSLLQHGCRADRWDLHPIAHGQTLLPEVNKMKQPPHVQTHPHDLQLSHCQGIASPSVR